MYLIIVLAFMLVLPVVSILIEPMVTHAPFDLWLLVGRWFIFWSLGVRLFTAGVRQILQPKFTAETIFETTDPGALKIIPELGFANVAAGAVGILSLFWPTPHGEPSSNHIIPIALYGAIFYGLAAALHVGNTHRNRTETIALVSDAGIALILALVVLAAALGW